MKLLSGVKIIGILAILLGCVSVGTGDPGVSSGLTMPNNSVLNKTLSNISSDQDNASNITGMITNRSDQGNITNVGGNNPINRPDNIYNNTTEAQGVNISVNGHNSVNNTTEIPRINKSVREHVNTTNTTEITRINKSLNPPDNIYNNTTEIPGNNSMNGPGITTNTTQTPGVNKSVREHVNTTNTTEIKGINKSLNRPDNVNNTTEVPVVNMSVDGPGNTTNTTQTPGANKSVSEYVNTTNTTEVTGNITYDNISAIIPPGVIEAWNLTQGADNITNTTNSTTGEISPVKNTSPNASILDNNTTAPYVPGEVIIQYKTTPLMNTIAGTIAKDYQVEAVGGEVADDHSAKGLEGLQTISVNNTSVSDIVAELNNSPIVEYAEPNYVISLDDYERESTTIPNDPHFAEQWALLNTGQSGGTAGADIDATAGWSYSTGSKNVIIAVIDSGVDYTHPDLSANIWTNPGEIPGNGIDDDGDGYIDDVYGYDFINNKADPMDDNGHGTHCAGVIGAVGNNGVGITGLNWNVKIMPLKVLKADGTGDTASVLNAIAYAKTKGASIISCSWGGAANSKALGDALANSGMLIICAAGNTGANNDINPHYPSNYDASNIIAVAASDANDKKPAFSNYGPLSVDVAAPGDAILSTYPTKLGSQYMSMRGTSMATPHVSGLAGLILAMDPSLSPTEVKQVITSHVDPLSAFSGKIVSGGRINVKSALSSLAKSEGSLVALPGSSSLPTIGSDGKITDLNGNKRTDFADIVLFFKNSDWISSHEPISPFDLNNNGKVDFNDIILFYNRMI